MKIEREPLARVAGLMLLIFGGTIPASCANPQEAISVLSPTPSATAEGQITPTATPLSVSETPTPTPTLKSVEKIVTKKILTVPQFKQQYNLSCVASCATMVSAFLGVSLSETEIIQQLPQDPNPHKGFRGNINGLNSNFKNYGVYAEPLVDVLGNFSLKARVSYGGGREEIKKTIDSGLPLIVWITYETQIQETMTETLASGEKFILVGQAHAVVVVDYDQSGVYVNDPYDGLRKHYSYDNFLRSWGYLGEMALTVSRPG